MSSSISSKVKLDQEVCADADKLVRLYTELADLRRNKIINLYSSNGPQLIWNGNCYSGLTEIGSFWDNLPSTQHEYFYSFNKREMEGGYFVVKYKTK